MKRIITVLLASVLLSSCSWDIYKEPTLNDVDEIAVSVHDSFDVSAQPAGLIASSFTYEDEIVVSWQSVKAAKAYYVERSSDLNTWTQIGYTTGLSVSDQVSDSNRNSPAAGTDYYYRVRARSTDGTYGAYSDVVTGRLLYSPVTVSASKGDNTISGISLEWSYIEGITSYEIWYGIEPDDSDMDITYTKLTRVDAVNSADDAYYLFGIDEDDTDKLANEYRFKVASVSPSTRKVQSLQSISTYAIGYAYVKGSPVAPADLTVSQAVSANPSDGLTISWTDTGDDSLSYYITRTSSGEKEVRIFPRGSSKLDQSTEGILSYTDKTDGLEIGKEYTYSVMATAEDEEGNEVKGPASTATGYFISPPETITLEGATSDGYTFSITPSIGFSSEADLSAYSGWNYVVYGWKRADNAELQSDAYSTAWNNGYSSQAALLAAVKSAYVYRSEVAADSLSGGKVQFSVPYSADYDSFTVTLQKDSSTESVPSSSTYEWYYTFSGVTASDNQYSSSMSANSSSIYPVVVTYTISNSSYLDYLDFTLLRDDSELQLDESEWSLNSRGYLSVQDSSTSEIGKTYTYSVKAVDVFGNTTVLASDTGYGAITDEKFVAHTEYFAMKPWEHLDENPQWASSSIKGKIDQAGTGSLGDITEAGTLGDNSEGSGTVHYTASVSSSLGGYVTFTYASFGTRSYIRSDGGFVMDVSMSQSGSCSGNPDMTISGLYPGVIVFDNISVSSGKFTGRYGVTQTGRSQSSVSPYQSI